MNTRQQAALTHLRLVGRDVHRYAAYALDYGLTAEQIRDAISEGVREAEREEGAKHGVEPIAAASR